MLQKQSVETVFCSYRTRLSSIGRSSRKHTYSSSAEVSAMSVPWRRSSESWNRPGTFSQSFQRPLNVYRKQFPENVFFLPWKQMSGTIREAGPSKIMFFPYGEDVDERFSSKKKFIARPAPPVATGVEGNDGLEDLLQGLEVTPITLKERIRPPLQQGIENGVKAGEAAACGTEARGLIMEVRLGTCFFYSDKYGWTDLAARSPIEAREVEESLSSDKNGEILLRRVFNTSLTATKFAALEEAIAKSCGEGEIEEQFLIKVYDKKRRTSLKMTCTPWTPSNDSGKSDADTRCLKLQLVRLTPERQLLCDLVPLGKDLGFRLALFNEIDVVKLGTEVSSALNAIVDSASLDPATSWGLHWPPEYLNGTAAPLVNRFVVESVRHKKRMATFKGGDRVWEVEEVEGVDFDREGLSPLCVRLCREITITLPGWNEEPKTVGVAGGRPENAPERAERIIESLLPLLDYLVTEMATDMA